jgi:hypothetical protein
MHSTSRPVDERSWRIVEFALALAAVLAAITIGVR